MSLKQKTVSGVKWNFASQAGQQITQVLTATILARLLSPSDFGLVGMAMVVIGFVNLFKDLGTSTAVIQCRETSEELLSSVFWANFAFGALGTIVLMAGAPLAARYFHEPRLVAILHVLAWNFVISGCTILQQTLFERALQFRIIARIEVTAVVVSAIVGVTSAYAGAGVWALVAQSLTSSVVSTVLLVYFSDWHPKFLFRWAELRRISSYSLNLSGFNIFNYFSRNADYILIGRYLGASPLGLYTLAYRIMIYPLRSVSSVISRVLFPVYSQLQDDDARFRSAYLRTVGMIALVTFPLMAGLFVAAEPFVLTVFGTKWLLAIPVLKILVPVGFAQSVLTTVGAIYQAKGRTDTLFVWGLVTGLMNIACFAIGLHWGITGVATAYAINCAVISIPSLLIPFRLVDLRMGHFLQALAAPGAAALSMVLVLMTERSMMGGLSHVAALEILIATGVIVYVAASWAINRGQVREALTLLARR